MAFSLLLKIETTAFLSFYSDIAAHYIVLLQLFHSIRYTSDIGLSHVQGSSRLRATVAYQLSAVGRPARGDGTPCADGQS